MPRLLDDLLGCIDRRQLEAVVRRHVTELTEETLDEWDDAARWRTLVTRFGSDAIHEAATLAAMKLIDDLLPARDA